MECCAWEQDGGHVLNFLLLVMGAHTSCYNMTKRMTSLKTQMLAVTSQHAGSCQWVIMGLEY